jgi:ankyrin repeat protein/L-ascorbate metabolism protein UlaG (beta-lactamase superfamily)
MKPVDVISTRRRDSMKAAGFLMVLAGLLVAVSCLAQTADVHRAARAGDCARLKELTGASPELVNARSEDGDVPLHTAALAGSMDAALYLIGRGADIEARNSSDQSPLLYAAYAGNAELVDTLIARGARFDYRDARGNSPLHFAARGGHMAVVGLLASKGARIDEKGNQGRTPLFLAAMNGRTEIVKFLLARGALPGTKADDGQTPMTIALGNGHAATAEELLDAGAGIEGDRAALARYLHLAAAAGSGRIVDTLIARGAALDDIGAGGRTLLHDAAIGGCAGLAATVVARGGTIDAADGRGKTALHYAVSENRGDIVGLLLERGADPNIADSDGRTPLHIAEDNVRGDIEKLLREKGARDTERRVYRLARGSARGKEQAGGAPLEVTYIANEGFLIARGEKKVLIDALHVSPFSYPMTGDRVFSMMLEKRPPFAGIDLSVVSHAHIDHFSPRMNAELLKRNGDVIFISSPEACDSLRAVAGSDFGDIAGRVVSVDPEWTKTEKLRENGIDIAFFGVNHAPAGEAPYKTLATVLDLDGIRLVHLADEIVGMNVENIEAAGLARDGIDIAFADRMFLADSIGQHLMREHIEPDYIILMHSGPDELDSAQNQLAPLHPNLIIFRDQMEKKLFAR